MVDKITCDDVLQYEHLFSKVPSFVLERMAKKNRNLVAKFESQIKSVFESLNETNRNKLDLILSSDVDYLQELMNEAYVKTDKKQFKILANPDYKGFIEQNLEEIRKLIQ